MDQPLPSSALLDRVYRALLLVLPLRKRERRIHLEGRGLPPE